MLIQNRILKVHYSEKLKKYKLKVFAYANKPQNPKMKQKCK